MEKTLKEKLQPLYDEMLKNISQEEDLYPFCIQWGNDFPKEKNTGVLFVGKATNGWVRETKDINIVFGDSNDRVFARTDQMKWIRDLDGVTDHHYNTRKSAFWRVIRRVTQMYYREDLEYWYSNIAWSNLYKVSHETGNPNSVLMNEQHRYCEEILKSEIEILSPKFVVLLTSGWEKWFLPYLNNKNHTHSTLSRKWCRYECKCYEIDNVIYIASHHPETKPEKEHAEAIYNIMKIYKF